MRKDKSSGKDRSDLESAIRALRRLPLESQEPVVSLIGQLAEAKGVAVALVVLKIL
jgi:hypothetical protein